MVGEAGAMALRLKFPGDASAGRSCTCWGPFRRFG